MFSQILQVILIQATVFENHCSREKTCYINKFIISTLTKETFKSSLTRIHFI